jgi:hypothetical protein
MLARGLVLGWLFLADDNGKRLDGKLCDHPNGEPWQHGAGLWAWYRPGLSLRTERLVLRRTNGCFDD